MRVVFYQGGNSEISGFELGTDLLWFFLSPDDLAAAKNGINQDGDLILDFGSVGTLTFLGVVPDQPIDGNGIIICTIRLECYHPN